MTHPGQSHPAPSGLAQSGLIHGLGAYLIWGFLPVLFKLLEPVSAGEIVAQRIVWSLLFVGVLIAFGGRMSHLRAALRQPVTLRYMALSAALIATNWLVFIWAILNHHLLEASLGYFLNPLVNVALGVLLLKERLGRAQGVAVALAAIGVVVLGIGAGKGLWISITLAMSFGLYGLVRKVAPVEATEGLSIETLLLLPFALAWLAWLAITSGVAFGDSMGLNLLLIISGPATAVPLLLFAVAARRMRYTTLGLLQYIAPTINFLLAVFAYGEALTMPHIICFALIWAGLAIYSASALAGRRRAVITEPT